MDRLDKSNRGGENYMKLRKPFLFAVVAVGAFSLVLGMSGGPPDGRTGGPGEGNCTQCHSSFTLNSGDGSLSITVPESYSPDDTLDITVSLSDPGQARWGFEITALDSNDQLAGELIVTEPTRTQKSSSGGREYIKHQSVGTDAGTPDAAPGWALRWVASGGVEGTVTFYAAGNAADNSSTNSGDYIYTASESTTQQLPIPTLSEWGLIIFALLILTLVTIVMTRREKATVRA
jgi:hypothetical protein